MSGIGKSPTEIEMQNTTNVIAASTSETEIARVRPVVRARRDDLTLLLEGQSVEGRRLQCKRHQRRQSSASFRRRTRIMKNGAPISAVMMPTCTSPGRAITRPTTSAVSSRIGASTNEYGSTHR